MPKMRRRETALRYGVDFLIQFLYLKDEAHCVSCKEVMAGSFDEANYTHGLTYYCC